MPNEPRPPCTTPGCLLWSGHIAGDGLACITPATVAASMEMPPGGVERMAGAIKRLMADRDRLRAAMTKINAIRNSIVGMQGFNFSEHAYPLVAALDEAGFNGDGYPQARANLGTLIEQRDAAKLRAHAGKPTKETP